MSRHDLCTLCLLAALSLLFAPEAFAQNGSGGDITPLDSAVFSNTSTQTRVTLNKSDDELYKGVIPGKRDEKDHISRSLKRKRKAARRVSNTLTWIGFRAEERRTRVFIQATNPPTYDVAQDDAGAKITLTFPSTIVAERNVTLFLDTSYWGRSVKRIETKRNRRNSSVDVILTVEPGAQPSFDIEGNYLYVDFRHNSDAE